jgi:UDP-2,4-diacetamido-2,4,6-trideoxy-beta-L-altropyranose hydrolase
MKIRFRKAVLEDADLYYNWVNDQLVRANSFNSNPINYENHVKWFSNKLLSDTTNFYLFINESNTPVGQVRIETTSLETVIGISIAKDFRGLGLSTEMLIQATHDYLKKHPNSIIIAYIKIENISSYKSFLKAGFKQETIEMVDGTESYKLIKKSND